LTFGLVFLFDRDRLHRVVPNMTTANDLQSGDEVLFTPSANERYPRYGFVDSVSNGVVLVSWHADDDGTPRPCAMKFLRKEKRR
jgi:hypothetical protein